jgi:hypothetical protein
LVLESDLDLLPEASPKEGMGIEELIQQLQQFLVRGDIWQYEIFHKQNCLLNRFYHGQLKVSRTDVDQQMILMNQFFVESFISYFLDKLVLE